MQADPYLAPEAPKNPQGWNRYEYVENDPVNWYDPSGLLALCPFGTVTAPDGRSCRGIDVLEEAFTRLDINVAPPVPGGGGGRDVAGGEDFDFERYRPECDRRDPENVKRLNSIGEYREDAAAVAEQLGVPTEAILGLSGHESGWGLGRFAREGNNFFGLHWPASFAIGYLVARGNPKSQDGDVSQLPRVGRVLCQGLRRVRARID
jgi:hypothetical protein